MTRRTLWIVVLAGIGLLSAGIAVLVLRHNVNANSDTIDRLEHRAATTVTGAPGPPGPPGSSVTVPVRVGGGSSTGTTSAGMRSTTSTSPTTSTTRPPSTTTTRCTVAVTGHCIVPN